MRETDGGFPAWIAGEDVVLLIMSRYPSFSCKTHS
jgi:hypothetical protein